MAHDTHHDTHNHVQADTKPTTSFRASFWFVIILAGLFIAAVNFVGVMSHDSEGGHDATHTEATHEGHEATTTHEVSTEAEHHEAETHEAAPADAHAEHSEAH